MLFVEGVLCLLFLSLFVVVVVELVHAAVAASCGDELRSVELEDAVCGLHLAERAGGVAEGVGLASRLDDKGLAVAADAYFRGIGGRCQQCLLAR